jgi:hypothetical protein
VKRCDDWRQKLNEDGIAFLEGYRQIRLLLRQQGTTPIVSQVIDAIIANYPSVAKTHTVEVTSELLDYVASIPEAAPLVVGVRPGKKRLAYNAGRFVEIFQALVLGLEREPATRFAVASIAAMLGTLAWGGFENEKSQRFGNAALTGEQMTEVVGAVLERAGRAIRRHGKAAKQDAPKGRVNVELIELIQRIRRSQRQKLTTNELLQALEYAGIHMPDVESLRVFEWRARKRGWIR